jgi:hydrogenase expression/formation protein HypC
MCLGVPGQVITLEPDGDLLMGKVDFGGVARRVCLAYVPDVAVGEYVVVHVGFALSKLSEAEAHRVYDLLRELDQLDEGGS